MTETLANAETEVLAFLKALIACPSVTPNDAGCQRLIAERLQLSGFKTELLAFDDVLNSIIRYGEQAPLFIFAGHTDVVTPGPLSEWQSPPFEPAIREHKLYGRGACDMKGALAAMVIAAENFVTNNPHFKGSIAFLLTSDEEGPAVNGTKKVIDLLKRRQEKIDYCVIGEPSSISQAGDQIRIGRRGSLHGKLTVRGIQGHVAYPELVLNPIHQSLSALDELTKTIWDEGNMDFPKTGLQITQIHSGTGSLNVVPSTLEIKFNLRFGNVHPVSEITKRAEDIFKKHQLKYDIAWEQSAEPFLTQKAKLIPAVEKAIHSVTGLTTQLSTGGGTSDGRFIAKIAAELIELGVPFKTAHHLNECVALADVEKLTLIYAAILKELFINQGE